MSEGSRSGEPLVLLVGMMGTGKSSVGRAVAARTGWRYVDNDELVRQACGSTAPELLAAEGEAALRAAENAALAAALALQPPAVASVAAGVVLDSAARDLLRSADLVIWLRASHSTLVDRVGEGEGRAWLQPNPAVAIATLSAEREPYYAEVADAIIDVDGISPEQTADSVIELARAEPS
ncbi:MAG: shikimate kinase [Pseudonocardiales bacterium]